MRKWQLNFVLIAYLSVLVGPIETCLAEDADNIEWVTEYGDARRLGMKLDRPVLLFVTTNNCGYCVKMQDHAFSDDQIKGDLQDSFVPAKLNLSLDDQLAVDLKVNIFPTTVIIAPSGKIIDYARGYLSKDQLRRRMVDAMGVHHSIASNR